MKRTLRCMAFASMVAAAASCADAAKDDGMEIRTGNPLTAQEIDAGAFTPEVMWKMGRAGAPVLSPDAERVLYAVTYYDMDADRGHTSLWTVPYGGGTPSRVAFDDANCSDPSWANDGAIRFLSDRGGSAQLWTVGPDGGEARQMTGVDGGIDGYGAGRSGMYWTKSAKVDKRRSAEIYPDADKSAALIYDDLMVRHWDHWNDGSHSHIFVAPAGDMAAAGTDIMENESWDAPMSPYFDGAEIAWSNGGTLLAYTCKKLTGTEYAQSTDSDIYVYDTQSKTTANLTEGMPGYDKYPRFSPDDRLIAFTSMRRAGNESDKSRLFVMNADGSGKRDLTENFDYNAENIVWGDEETIYFIAPMEATLQLCRIGVSGGDVEVLTGGDHDIVSLDVRGGRVVVGMQTMSMATELFAVEDGKLRQLTFINKEIYDNIPMGGVAKRWVATTDDKKMLTWVITPPDFDPAKKYPVLLYCQGGPQSVVSQFWSYRWNMQLMAARGYVVVAPNRRGLPSFGQEWLDQISGDYSGQNIRDYLSAVDEVAGEPWADETRMGCVGASYGGYSVYYLAGNHRGRFRAFVSHCGIFDFESMYGETEELFFVNNDYGGPYWDKMNPTAVRSYANSPHRSVQNWDTPMLIITCMNDFRIPYTQSLEAFTAARVRGIPSRLVAFENEAHQVFGPQNSIVWNREFFGWLDRYVKGAE